MAEDTNKISLADLPVPKPICEIRGTSVRQSFGWQICEKEEKLSRISRITPSACRCFCLYDMKNVPIVLYLLLNYS